jgi:cation diffusion facilitator family transporter
LVGASKKVIYAALFGNLGIAIAKFAAAAFTGSISMWAEAFHSMSDTFNQILLLIGIRTSKKHATEQHPFGYGKEQFFWSFIVSTLLFGISGGIAVEQGINSIVIHPHHLENTSINYLILAISAVFEGNSLRLAYSRFKSRILARGQKVSMRSLVQQFQESKDPSVLTVMVEDSAAILGIIVAAAGIFFSDLTGKTIFDAISSLIIGVILMIFAFFLARENKALLIGEAISKREYRKIYESVIKIPEVNRIVTLRTMHFSPDDVLVAMEVNLKDGLDTDRIERVIDRIEQQIKIILPYINLSKIFIELEQDSCPVDYMKRKTNDKKNSSNANSRAN